MAFFNNVCEAMDGFGQEAGKHISGAAHETAKHLDAFGQEPGKQIGPALYESWKCVDALGQHAGKQVEITAQRIKSWIETHPGETAGIVACVVAAPVGAGVTTGVLNMVGFTATGIASGSMAAVAQSGIGNATAGSTFAFLQSAGAGGAAATLVQGLAASTATAVAVSATLPGLMKAVQEGEKEVTIEGVHYMFHNKEEVESLAQDGEKKDA